MRKKVLTSPMRRLLLSVLEGNVSLSAGNTGSALRSRELINTDGSLTNEGWAQAVVLSKLETQCDKLGICFEQLKGLDYQSGPEIAACEYFKNRGYAGAYCEGGPILLLIRSAALEVLAKLNTFKSREDALTRFTEAQLTIHADHVPEICAAIRSSSSVKVEGAFEEIYESIQVRDWFPGLDANIMARLFDAIGGERIAEITYAIAEVPYNYRNGWPDLTMVNGAGELMWIEVKTTDKLHLSQVNTLRRMKPLLPGKIGVVQLS